MPNTSAGVTGFLLAVQEGMRLLLTVILLLCNTMQKKMEDYYYYFLHQIKSCVIAWKRFCGLQRFRFLKASFEQQPNPSLH